MDNSISQAKYYEMLSGFQEESAIDLSQNTNEICFFYESLDTLQKDTLYQQCSKKVYSLLKEECNYREEKLAITFKNAFLFNCVKLIRFEHTSFLKTEDGVGAFHASPNVILASSQEELANISNNQLEKELAQEVEKTKILFDFLEKQNSKKIEKVDRQHFFRQFLIEVVV